MFISKKKLNDILARLDRLERETGELDGRFTRESAGTLQKHAFLLARIRACEENRFVRDKLTGKWIPLLTGVGDAARELETVPKAGTELDLMKKEVEKIEAAAAPKPAALPETLQSAGPAARFEYFRNRAAAPESPDGQAPLLAEAEKKERTELDRWTRIYRTVTGSIQGGATPPGLANPAAWIEGRNRIPALCAKVAPNFRAFLRAAPGQPKHPISFLSCAVYRGAVTVRPRGNGYTGRAYYEPDVVNLFRRCERIVTETAGSAEFIQEGNHADTEKKEG